MEPKKKWEKPQLVVLVRNQPEETVLFACKGSGDKGTSKNNKNLCFVQSGRVCPSACYDIFPS